MKTSPITWAIIRILTRRGKRHVKELRSNCARAGELNRELLMRIVHDNRDTEYGWKYHFDRIRSVEDYKRLVPLSNYDSYAPYIERMTDKGGTRTDHGISHYPVCRDFRFRRRAETDSGERPRHGEAVLLRAAGGVKPRLVKMNQEAR